MREKWREKNFLNIGFLLNLHFMWDEMENVSGSVLSVIYVFKTTSKLITSSGGQQTNLVQY